MRALGGRVLLSSLLLELTSAVSVASRWLGARLPSSAAQMLAVAPPQHSHPSVVEVGYLTDVEGNLGYFDRWVAQSEVLRYNASSELELTHPHAYFVYGGDAVDRGDGGCRLLQRLVALKRSAPRRVWLLVGNRDLNKLRLTSELGEAEMARDPSAIPGPHWDPRAPTLAEHLAATGHADSRAERLRYMYLHTLGCPETFELRRREMSLLYGRAAGDAKAPSDEEVVEAAVGDVLPGGLLRTYMEHADVAVLLGHTLFVHGSVDARTMRFVPGERTRFCLPTGPQPGRTVDSVDEWCDGLNALLRHGLADHAARPYWDAARRGRGGEQLMALQNRDAMWGRSVISNCYCDGGTITSAAAAQQRAAALEKDPRTVTAASFRGVCADPRDAVVAAWLRLGGVRRVVVGHKPSGDSIAPLSWRYTGVEILSADTSYADPAAADGRGVTMACLTLRGPSLLENHAVLSGVLRDGARHAARMDTLGGPEHGLGGAAGLTGCLPSGDRGAPLATSWLAGFPEERAALRGGTITHLLLTGGDPLVGIEHEEGGWWVKTLTAPDVGGGAARYLCCRGAGRRVEYEYRSVAALRANAPLVCAAAVAETL